MKACAASPAETTALPAVAASTSLRRSTASATAPPSSPIVTVGTSSATPIRPTANGDRVMSYTCSGTANRVMAEPTADSVDPAHNRRNAADSRSGLRSASSRPDPRGPLDPLGRPAPNPHLPGPPAHRPRLEYNSTYIRPVTISR